MGFFDEFMVHTVSVFPQQIATEDLAGSPSFRDGVPVQVVGMMNQLSSKELNLRGMELVTTFEFTTVSEWPGGAVSRIEWGSRKFEQFGAAEKVSMGWETDHTVVILTEIAPEAK